MTPKEAIDNISEIQCIITDAIPACDPEDNWERCTITLSIAKKALEKQAEYRNRIKDLITIIENICKDSRERHIDDEHCGLCEYDGEYIGESGDWCNECPGFDKDDCFELSNRFISRYIDWSGEE